MLRTILITAFLFFLLMTIMRIMGRRQIGQLQPGELVITILISEIAAVPLQSDDSPFIEPVAAILLLTVLELLTSFVCMKNIKIRNLIQGNSLVIIRNGVIDQAQIKRLRYTMDDILEALRQKDIFNISDIQYAVAETNGSLSVLLKPEKREVTIEDASLQKSNEGLQCVLISDGRMIRSEFKDCGMTEQKLRKIIKDKKIEPKDILLLSTDAAGNMNIIKKEKGKKNR